MTTEDIQSMQARIAFLENCLQIVTSQRETALNSVAELTVQRDAAQRHAGALSEKLQALEAKLKTG